MKKEIILGAVLLTAFALKAKTVALWPMEYDEVRQTPNMRCAVSSENGFTTVPAAMTFEPTTIGWNLPPNPDTTDGKLFSPASYYDLVSDPTADNGTSQKNLFKLTTPGLTELLKMRHDFTLEGWIKPMKVQDESWHIIFQSNGGSSNGYFSWMIRNDKVEGDVRHFGFYVYAQGRIGDVRLGPDFTEQEAIDLTNSWHHIALAFDYENANGKSEFTMYYDGELRGTSGEFAPFADDYEPEFTQQTFGGRESGCLCLARWNYWRLSDEVLSPEDLLNYGGTGTVVPKPEAPVPEKTKTIGYWKLGADADGYISGHDIVGDFELSRGLLDNNGTEIESMGLSSSVAASKDKPFVQPPNTTATIPDGLRGCFRASGTYSHVLIPGVGPQLELDNDFTVEAYVRFLENEGFKDRYPNADCYLFGNARGRGSNRWALRMGFSDNPRRLTLMVYDYINNTWAAGGDFCEAPKDSAWHHLAMVYDGTADVRMWTLYIDGQDKGSVSYPQSVPSDPYASYLMLFGRGGPDAFPGEMACVRACKAKLNPKQFLCESADPQAATDVIGYWPLDTKDGVTLDGRDVATGVYSFTHGEYDGDDYKISSVDDDQPVVTNPERKLGVYALDGTTHGAVRFRNGDIGKKSYLFHRASGLSTAIQGATTEWTIEFFTKRDNAPTCGTPGELILAMPIGTYDAAPDNNWSQLMVAYGTRGFTVYDQSVADFRSTYCHVDTAVCPDTIDAIPLNVWTHVAVTRHYADGAVTYTFYVGGVKKGEMTGMVDSTSGGSCVFFGGCYNFWGQDCAWRGLWSSLRLSRGVLATSEFLCATPATPVPTQEPETLAYWSFDYRNGVVDLGSRSLYRYTPWNLAAALVAGSDERAVWRVANPAEDLPVTNLRNYGSVSVARGAALTYPGLAEKLGYDRAFTVEGWIKWTAEATSKDEILFGACGSANVAHGWRVFVDYSGAKPALKLYANASNADYGAVAGNSLVGDISSWNGVWKHLSLVYDPADGANGTWKLYVDGALAGIVENAWYPGVASWAQTDFAFGSAEAAKTTGFTGALDAWRVVTRALSQEELLTEAERLGMSLILR